MARGRWIALAVLLCASPAAAQPADPRKAEAIAHFDKGNELRERGAWAEALAEYLRARELYPTSNGTINAAICLRQLGHEDEALDLLEALLRDSPNLAAEKRQDVEREVSDLRALVGSVEIEGGARGATIEIDGRARGALPVAGPVHVKAGSHLVRALAEGFSPFEARVEVAGAETVHLVVKLQPLPAVAPLPTPPPASVQHRISLEIDGALVVAPTFGGDVAGTCQGGCTRSPGLGGYAALRGGYGIGSHFDVGLTAGFLAANETTTGRRSTLQPVGLPARQGTVNDTLELRGVLAGAWAGARFGQRALVELRLGAGALLGWVGDTRTGTFGYQVGPDGVMPFAAFVYLDPQIRVGLHVSEHVTLTAGLEALLLFTVSHPTWDARRTIDASQDGDATFAAESLVDRVAVVVAPGAAARYEF